VRGTEIVATDTPQQYREKLARIALDEMYQFVAVLDPRGTLLEVNRAALEGGGVERSDVEGKPFWECFWWTFSADSQRALEAAIARAARGEFIRYDVEVYGRAGGKETIVIDFSMIPVKDDTGAVVFIVPEGRDITEKKAYEREIARKNADLQSLLERIRELDEIKTQFFANVSHELRTPLALILGPAERLLAPAAMRPDELRETAQVIVRNAKMLLKHVNDLLDISKLEAGKLKIDLHDTDLCALVRYIASHFEIIAAERRVDFRVEVPPSWIGAVDPDKLQRVVMNLLSNAFKFVPRGGVVRCKLEVASDKVVLSVEDSGPGVDPALREAIFERFRQGDGAANREVSGTGLGLAIAQEFVEMHKGSIEARASDLGGAWFRVTLPAHRMTRADVPSSSPPAADRSTLDGLVEELRVIAPSLVATESAAAGSAAEAAKPLVLVVEDNPEMNRFIVQCLSGHYRVISAFDGQQGLEKALALYPSLIVSDIMMPRVSGVEMIAELRKRAEMVETPIVVLSAKADDELKARLLAGGAQDFITKPFTERDLLVRVGNLIEIKRSRDQLREAERVKRHAIEMVNRELESRSTYLRDLFERAPGFMVVLRGRSHVFELANAAYYTLVGHRDIVGKSVIEALPEVAGQGFIELLDHVLATGEPYVGTGVPAALQREPGGPLEQRYVDFVYQPLRDANGGITGVFVEGNDVTDHKQAEAALRAADQRKDEFLATLAHELRNPLAPIRHAARISKTPNATEAQVSWAHDIIERQVQHMAVLLDDLLDVSRITRGKLELRKERLALADNLTAAVETVRPLIEARGHTLTVEVVGGAASARVDADPVRFAQIFTNLLTNASKYTDPGGKIRVRAELGTDHVVVTIADNGIGIRPDLLPGIFEMFSQATTALERSEGGLGIGLALVRGLLSLHGGSIEARSAGLGSGSEFVVTLPTVSQPDVVAAVGTEPLPDHLRVLIADDNRDSADSFAMFLQIYGHDVRTAYAGDEALAIAAELRPQVALVDIGMPQVNGYEVARRIRAATWGKDMILIAITGWGQDEDKRQAEAAGFDHHLVKPVSLDRLQSLIAQLVLRAR
jgi:PAS domain S-box-containing protein